MKNTIIEMKNIYLSLNDIPIIKDASFSIEKGELCVLIGQNGAGKTNLMKVLSGVYKIDSGSIFLENQKIKLESIRDIQNLGISMIYHEDNLIKEFNVMENIFLGKEITHLGKLFVDKEKQMVMLYKLMKKLEINIDIDAKINELKPIQRKFVEILKAVINNTKVLVLDEITVSSTIQDSQRLLEIITKLKEIGITIIVISHKMNGILHIADKVLVMNEGSIVFEGKVANDHKLNFDDIMKKISSEGSYNRYPKTNSKKGKVILETRGISDKQSTLHEVSIRVKKGEIIGIAGLNDSGKSNLIKLISGIDNPQEGDILLDGIAMHKYTKTECRKEIAYLSQNSEVNLIGDMDIQNNISLSNMLKISRFGFFDKNSLKSIARYFISKFNLKEVLPTTIVSTLSKGMQQKVALAKWLNADARVFIFDEPTSNLDVVSRVEFYNIINEMTQSEKSIILASNNFAELVGMCDRIYVLYKGKIVAELDEKNKSILNILNYASGEIHNN